MAILEKYESIRGKMTTRRMMLIVKFRVTRVRRVGIIVATHRAIPFAT
jgi:hypothetical protein